MKLSALKQAAAAGVALPDAAVQAQAASPVPLPAIANKPAPGRQGPRGVSPRTSYSRVNTGAPEAMDAGGSAQKALPADPMRMLPEKVAEAEAVVPDVIPRLSIQDMIKAAAEGSARAAKVSEEALRQLASDSEVSTDKVAEARVKPTIEHVSTVYVDKLAAAVEYILEAEKEAEEASSGSSPGPGTGPGALGVLEARASEKNVDAGEQGQATDQHQPPQTPPTHKDPSRSADPATGLQTNDSTMHGEQPVKVSSAEAPIALIRKIAAARSSNGAPAAGAVDTRLVDYLVGLRKQAEDALNPAKISAGPAIPPETSAAEEPGGAPAGGMPQGSTALVQSNEAAINYTKEQAKSKAKADAGKVLEEPVLSARTDKTLERTLDHAPEAGVKISEAARTLAARALLEKLAAEAKDKQKKKQSIGGMGSYQAPAVGGAAGGTLAGGGP